MAKFTNAFFPAFFYTIANGHVLPPARQKTAYFLRTCSKNTRFPVDRSMRTRHEKHGNPPSTHLECLLLAC